MQFFPSSIIYMEVISAWAMRFQHKQCDFCTNDAISAQMMRFQLKQCDFSTNDAIFGGLLRWASSLLGRLHN
jgi:hypothetical protein